MDLDAASSGALINSPQDVVYNLIKLITKNHHARGSVRQVDDKSTHKTSGMYEVNVFDHMNTKVDALYQKIDSLSIAPFTPTIPTLIVSISPIILYCVDKLLCRANNPHYGGLL